jgi:hypothetical protein
VFLSTLLEPYDNVCCFIQNCARILLDKDHIKREKYFEKMINPKLDGLQKMAVFDDIMKNFKSAKKECPRCGYINGMFHALF